MFKNMRTKSPVRFRPNIDADTVLYVKGVHKSFDGFKAINDLNLFIKRGELRCIIGPNGAGKTTVMDIVTGKTKPDTGEVWLDGTLDVLTMSETDIANAGIGRKFQKPTVIECLTVWENLELALEGPRTPWAVFRAEMSTDETLKLQQALETIGLQNHRHIRAGQLSHGQKQWLEIGMLLVQNPMLLLIDEPVAGMTHQEMDRTAVLLKSLAGTHSVVVVEHDMDFVRSLQSPITVLHQGTVLAQGTMAQVRHNRQVQRVYLGE